MILGNQYNDDCTNNILFPQYHQVKENTDSKLFWQAMHNIDYKFILIPVMFIFLRIWTLVLNMLEIYLQIPPEDIVPWAMKALLYLSVSLLIT